MSCPRRILLDTATALSFALLCATALAAWKSAGDLHDLQYNHVRHDNGQTLTWVLKAGCNGRVFWFTHASDWNDARNYYGQERGAVIDQSRGWTFDGWRHQYPPGFAPPPGPFPPAAPGFPGTGWGNFRFCHTTAGAISANSGPWNAHYAGRTQSLTAPTWAILLTCALLPATRLTRSLARRRHPQPGLCPTCHYDLRATPTRCPECGRVTAADAGVAPAPGT